MSWYRSYFNMTLHFFIFIYVQLSSKEHQIPQCKINSLQMFQSKPLHLHHLIITSSVIEGVASLREVVQYISGVKNWYPAAVHPGYPEKVVCKLNKTFN